MSTDLPLIDHHCHGVISEDLDEAAFERWLSESDLPVSRTFDTPLGYAVRAWCAPVLDLEPHAPAERYHERRRELGGREASRRLLVAANLEAALVDTGIEGHGVDREEELGSLAGVPVRRVTRLETVAAQLIRDGVGASEYVDAYERRLREESAGAVALKSVIAYRGGLGIDPERPSLDAVRTAASRFLGSGRARVDDETLLRHGLWTGIDIARDLGIPVQFHTGFGDTDADLHLTDPSLLTPLIRQMHALGVDVALLHGYPYHRNAAYLAAMFPNVYVDVGLALNHAAGGAARILAELMDLAPIHKILYSSDAVALAELHFLGALLFRRALATTLERWHDADLIDAGDAASITMSLASGNARRLYSLA